MCLGKGLILGIKAKSNKAHLVADPVVGHLAIDFVRLNAFNHKRINLSRHLRRTKHRKFDI